MIKKIGKILYDHWLQIFSVLLGLVGVGAIIKFWNFIKQKFLYSVCISVWLWCIIIVVIFAIIIVAIKLVKRRKKLGAILCPNPSDYEPKYKEFLADIPEFGVMWKLYFGNDFLRSQKQRIWVEGPFCLECHYELDRENLKKWKCNRCIKRFKIPKHIREDTKERVTKIFGSDFRK